VIASALVNPRGETDSRAWRVSWQRRLGSETVSEHGELSVISTESAVAASVPSRPLVRRAVWDVLRMSVIR
jgi:hypothetical protein